MNNYKILILEDVPFDAELIEREISRAGLEFTSRVVELEGDYLDAINEFKPDLILADHSLPHFDGISALKIAQKECPEVPFIFVSGKIGEEFAVEALKKGATDYVLKSNLSKVGPAIKRAIEAVKEQQKLKKAEENLHKSHWQLMEAQKIGHIGSWEWDIAQDNLECSDEFYRILGVNKSDFTPNFQSWMEYIHFEDRQRVSDVINGAIDNIGSFSDEYRIIRPDGTIRIIVLQGKVITNDLNQPRGMIGTEQDITERKIVEDKIKDSLEEKELLLQEIHHRVKNNLQIISSLMRLQSRHIKDPEALKIFKESQNRVNSIALVHEKLYQAQDMACINFADYIRDLSRDLFHFFQSDTRRIKLNLDLDEIRLNIETAISCGLIVNELITNSLKHAFSDGEGEIYVGLHKKEDSKQIILTIADNGKGIPDELNIDNIDSFGLQLVYNLSKRIKGDINLDRKNGTQFNLCFQELNYGGRT